MNNKIHSNSDNITELKTRADKLSGRDKRRVKKQVALLLEDTKKKKKKNRKKKKSNHFL